MITIRNIEPTFQWTSIFNIIVAIFIGILCGIGSLFSPLLTIIAVIAIIYVFHNQILSDPLIASCWLVVFITFGSAMPRGKIIPMLAPNELVLLFVFMITVLNALKKREDKPIATTILISSLILIAGTSIAPIIGYKVRGIPISFRLMFRMIAPAQYILVFWIFSVIPQNREDRLRILQVMFLCASFVSIIALLQAMNVPFILSFLRSWYPSDLTLVATGETKGRVTSVLGAWNTLGTFNMISLLSISALQTEKMPQIYKWNMVSSAILALLSLLASGSFAGLGGLVVGFIALKIIDPRGLKTLLPFFIVAALGGLLILPNIQARIVYQFGSNNDGTWVPNTLAFRFAIWRDIYIPLIRQSPWWGATPTFEHLSFQHADSQYLLLLAKSGIVSLMAFTLWIMGIMLWLFNILRGDLSMMRLIALVTFISFGLLVIMGITNPVFTYSGVMDYLWIYLGLIASEQPDKSHVFY